MRTFFVYASLVAIALIAGCTSGNQSTIPLPTRDPIIQTVNVPTSVDSGQNANLDVTWIHGLEPFTVQWTYNCETGAPDVIIAPPFTTVNGYTERTHSTNVMVTNISTEPVTVTGTVTITDGYQTLRSQNYSFIVNSGASTQNPPQS